MYAERIGRMMTVATSETAESRTAKVLVAVSKALLLRNAPICAGSVADR
jgi:hypothetical protein